jgi:hypothetical protein
MDLCGIRAPTLQDLWLWAFRKNLPRTLHVARDAIIIRQSDVSRFA